MSGNTFILAAASATFSWTIAVTMRRYASRLGFVDRPNERSLHSRITPRGGGLGFALFVSGAAAVQALTGNLALGAPELAVLISAIFLALLGLVDDRWTLPVSAKLPAHFCAAAAVVAAGGLIREFQIPGGPSYELGILAVPVTLLWLMFLTNIYNFMDGIDGLAAAQAIVAALAMAALAACYGSEASAALLIVLAAGVAGFLPLNWAPSRIFMGDVGSTFLGFAFAGWMVVSSGNDQGALPLMAWLAVLSPFIVDASFTLAVRAYRGERLYKAHRDHIYQRLVRAGWTHSRTAMLYGGLAALAGALTLSHYCLRLIAGPTYLLLTAVAVPIPLFVLARRYRR